MKLLSHIISINMKYRISVKKHAVWGNTGILRAGPQRMISYKTLGLKRKKIVICS